MGLIRFAGNSKRVLAILLGLLCGLSAAGLALAQNPNETVVKPGPNALDSDELYDDKGNLKLDGKLWVLHFKFKPLRSIKVNVPGRGEQVCYYLWYQVINYTSRPHTFVPDIELVTHDTSVTYRSEILPTVQDAIAKLEDPRGVLNIKNAITIAKEPIPAAKPNSIPRPVTGVAIFTDPADPLPGDSEEVKRKKAKMPKLIDSNFFSVFVAGLSNGYAETDLPDGDKVKTVVTRKTLQIKFRRFGDGALRRDEDVRYIEHEWLYRASSLNIPKDDKPADAGAPPKKQP